MATRQQLANAIRALSMDSVEKANSGHPGMPMGMADIAEVVWNDFLQFNPNNPYWPNRDRFVLSNGHGSMLLYSVLHLTGYDVSIDDLKAFRQLHSKTPGHPEFNETPGVETTTGPLGQGIANAVGFALAERLLANEFNKPDHEIIDHYTFTFLGDGCMMEGVSHEACSLAGTLGLGKLIALWDDNNISIDGEVSAWFGDDTPARFEAYHWHVIRDVDGHDAEAIKKAIEAARKETQKPTLICCKTHIGYGSPNRVDTAKAHGAPLGADEIAATRVALRWEHAPYEIPEDIYAGWRRQAGDQKENAWRAKWEAYKNAYPAEAAALQRRLDNTLPDNLRQDTFDFMATLIANPKAMATRQASQQCIEYFAPRLPGLLGGSADLTGSNNTNWSGTKAIGPHQMNGNYIHYGVREFGMAAIMNGLALHGGFIPYGGTFLTFSDYARNAIRLAALMKTKAIYVLSHDSVGLGEDGPTHQPIEHAASLRLIPGLSVWRPADVVESAAAWHFAITHQGPSALLLSRQSCQQQDYQKVSLEDIFKGGYVLFENGSNPDILFIATGTEVDLAIHAAKALTEKGKTVRVVSMPCLDVFLTQPQSYRDSVLPPSVKKRVAIEAGSPDSWYRLVGDAGIVIGIEQFGYSAPANVIMEQLGLTPFAITQKVENYL